MKKNICFTGDPVDTDYTAVGCAITTISSNLTEMSKGVKLLAALMDDEVGSGEDLLKAARTLASAVSDLLKAVQPTSGEVNTWKLLRVPSFKCMNLGFFQTCWLLSLTCSVPYNVSCASSSFNYFLFLHLCLYAFKSCTLILECSMLYAEVN